MSDEIALQMTKEDGSIKQKHVPIDATLLDFRGQELVAVSDNTAQLTCVTALRIDRNALTEIPAGVLAMTQLTLLLLDSNRLAEIPREIGRLRALHQLFLSRNKLTALPREIGQLVDLQALDLMDNELTSLPAELGQLTALKQLYLPRNRLTWLPMQLDRLSATTQILLASNPLPIDVGRARHDSRSKLPELFAATTAIAMIRSEATTLAVGMQDLELPALVTLEIVDAAFPNSIPMHKKWDLVVAVKHFHERHGIARPEPGAKHRRRVRRVKRR